MKTAASILALAAGASAFTSTQPASRSTAVRAAVDDMPGAIDLRGKEFKFDPVCAILASFRCQGLCLHVLLLIEVYLYLYS